MNLADEMLLAQMRESVLHDIPADQWGLVVDEVEKAGGVRQLQGYAKTLLFDAITKASFGGDRSEAGRYAANVRWQAEGQAGKEGDGSGRKAWKGATEERLIRLFHRRYFDDDGPGASEEEDELFRERGWLTSEGKVNPEILARGGAVGKYPIPADATFEDREAFDRADTEATPNSMPPEYNDYGDEPSDTDRAGRALRAMSVPIDLKNPLASQAKTTPDSSKTKNLQSTREELVQRQSRMGAGESSSMAQIQRQIDKIDDELELEAARNKKKK